MTSKDSSVVDRIKDLYSKGVMDKRSIRSIIRRSTPMEQEDFDRLHKKAIDEIVETASSTKEEKRALALLRLSYLQSKVMADEASFSPKVLLEIERLRMSVEGTEAPKEISQTIRAETIVATTKDEADQFFLDMGFINTQFDDKEIEKLLLDEGSQDEDDEKCDTSEKLLEHEV